MTQSQNALPVFALPPVTARPVRAEAITANEDTVSDASSVGSSEYESLPAYEDAIGIQKLSACKDHDHIVQFYDTEEFLFNVIVGFVAPALIAREAAVIIATKSHLEAIEHRLQARGLDLEARKRRGQLTLLDAHEILGVLEQREQKQISAAKFDDFVGTLARRLSRQFHGRVYVYGEIVDILASRGDYQLAVELEQLWNGLQNLVSFTLLCGYNLNNFRDQSHRDVFHKVCHTHSKVTPSEGYADLHDKPDDQALMVAQLQQKAKALENEIERRKAAEAALHNSLKLLSDHAQEALCRERDQYRTLLSILPVGVYGTAFGDEDDYFINNRFCEIVGRTRTEIRINGWVDAVHPEDRKDLSTWPFSPCDTCADIDTGNHEYRFIHADGSIVWVAGQTAANRDESGNLRGYVHTILDISALKVLERDRLEARNAAEKHQRHRAEEAERYKKDQDQWIDSLCHELRNPLNGISGNVELLEMGLQVRRTTLAKNPLALDDVRTLQHQLDLDQDSIDAISKCVAHQKIITDDVLNISKLELGKLVLRAIPFDPKTTLSDVAKMFEAQATRQGLDLRVNLSISSLPITGDPHRLSQIVINLMANAIKFTQRGSITLSLFLISRTPTSITYRVTVQDTGIGLTEPELAMLFQRFAQPTSTHPDTYGGSGLGLYLSKGMVELMGGTISVSSTKHAGSSFSFTFSGPPAECTPPPPPQPLLHTPRSIQTVLVVEDNILNQKIMYRFLAPFYRVLLASNGIEALEVYKEADLVFMDIVMPGMGGLECTMEIRQREREQKDCKRVPIVGLSGNARQDQISRAFEVGMNDYLTKPVCKKRVLEVVDGFEGLS
ncbi:PAS domain S-box protein [Spizellomyces punctatus DAOM BR117]|uniref:histidine kinase n=1 Tax=Spizellomyces punctatus (strain DAOM BR117) TaxID=645134 RepID=A0A0L0HHD0_SPIPD|nr:PAS domain S-box protein [Spizellomyces punctatus DAOM BR117]KND00199.1 PAS domain S-box protein [Spizellomyces punctatus DAOM BR117]|eukprot:XP_016608238.1 PAS domain S-box protein [Spizellomyces punctatus DAOM BR117]